MFRHTSSRNTQHSATDPPPFLLTEANGGAGSRVSQCEDEVLGRDNLDDARSTTKKGESWRRERFRIERVVFLLMCQYEHKHRNAYELETIDINWTEFAGTTEQWANYERNRWKTFKTGGSILSGDARRTTLQHVPARQS